MVPSDFVAFAAQVSVTMQAFGARDLSEAAAKEWFAQLKEFHVSDVIGELQGSVRYLKRSPHCADLWERLNNARTERIERTAVANAATEKAQVRELFHGRTPNGQRILRELGGLLDSWTRAPRDRLAWAYQIMDRVADGPGDPKWIAMGRSKYPSPMAIEDARQALNWPKEQVIDLLQKSRDRAAQDVEFAP